ncbi:MAG: hypothetical protein H0X62_00530 [Bacteroidetes bacterium]|nr:hypothetical protein [Bacteroidota bacterium]
MKSTDKKKSPRTGKKNSEQEKPMLDEDLKNKAGKGITASKGGFKDVSGMKGKSEKKGK